VLVESFSTGRSRTLNSSKLASFCYNVIRIVASWQTRETIKDNYNQRQTTEKNKKQRNNEKFTHTAQIGKAVKRVL